jgi:hypothetical protein
MQGSSVTLLNSPLASIAFLNSTKISWLGRGVPARAGLHLPSRNVHYWALGETAFDASGFFLVVEYNYYE